jgi:hypothetical protein
MVPEFRRVVEGVSGKFTTWRGQRTEGGFRLTCNFAEVGPGGSDFFILSPLVVTTRHQINYTG